MSSSVTDSGRGATDAGRGDRSWLEHWGPAIAVSLTMFVAVIDSTLMNVAIPALVADLDTTVVAIQGAIAVYSMVMAALILPGGKLGAIVPTRRLMTVSLVVYGIGTLLAAVSWNVAVLYVGWSLVEGAAAAVLLPLTFTVLVRTYSGRDRATALGILAGVNATGAAVGPILGGALTTFASWRWGFAGEVLVVVVALGFVRYLSNDPVSERREPFDLGGTILSILAVTGLVVGFLLAGRYGWLLARRPFVVGGVQFTPFGTSPALWAVGVGLLAAAAFLQWERRVDRRGGSPLVPVGVLRNGRFTAGVVTNASRSVVLAGFIFAVPIYLQSAVGYSAFEAGLALLPFSLATLVASTATTGWRAYVAPKTLVQTGIVLSGLGLVVLFGRTSLTMTIAGMVVPMTLFGLGVGLVMAQLLDTTLSAVPEANASEASGVLNSVAMLGYSLGVAVVGAFMLRSFYAGVVDGVLGATDAAVSLRRRGELVIRLEDAVETATAETQAAFVRGLSPAELDLLSATFDAAMVGAQRATLLLLTLLLLVTLLASTTLPGGRPASEADVELAGTAPTPPGEVDDRSGLE